MNPDAMRYARWLFWATAAGHLVQSVCVHLSVAPLHVTTLHDIYRLTPGFTAVFLFVAGALGLAAPLIHDRYRIASLAALIPQQFAVIVALVTALECVRGGHFADGLPYDPKFILADQVFFITKGVAHLLCVAQIYLYEPMRFIWKSEHSKR